MTGHDNKVGSELWFKLQYIYNMYICVSNRVISRFVFQLYDLAMGEGPTGFS